MFFTIIILIYFKPCLPNLLLASQSFTPNFSIILTFTSPLESFKAAIAFPFFDNLTFTNPVQLSHTAIYLTISLMPSTTTETLKLSGENKPPLRMGSVGKSIFSSHWIFNPIRIKNSSLDNLIKIKSMFYCLINIYSLERFVKVFRQITKFIVSTT